MDTYSVVINGIRTTIQADAADVERLGLTVEPEPEVKAAPKPANKARTAANKEK